MRIQHNIMAMNAYRNYNTNTSALSKNLERLSSGYKINRAGDDAAGLAISEKMRAQITGLSAASKNVKDGISLVKTAEGAMQEIQDMLNRMDYLATQSANGTYDNDVDRANLQKEVEALKTEINRIADSANFNGIQLLDGSQSAAGSSGVDVNIDLKVDNASCTRGQLHEVAAKKQKASFDVDLKQAIYNAKATGSIAANTGSFTIGITIGKNAVVNVKVKGLANAVATGGSIDPDDIATLNFTLTDANWGNGTGVELEDDAGNKVKFEATVTNGVVKFKLLTNEPEADFNVASSVDLSATGMEWSTDAGSKTTWNCETQNTFDGVAVKNDQLAHGEFEFTKNMANALAGGGSLTIADKTITFDKDTLGADQTSGGGVVGIKDLLDSNGNIKVDDASLAEMVTRIAHAADGGNTFTVGAEGKTIALTEKYNYYDSSKDLASKCIDTKEKFAALLKCTGSGSSGSSGLTLQIGDTAESYNQLTVSIGDMHTSAMKSAVTGDSIANVNIGTQSGAQDAIQTIRDAINYVSSVRGDLGAVQNRLEHTANNLSVMAENIQDAESTIRDTDIAEEMMSYTKNNILVQSAQAMLAQANAVPQGVLQLLG